MRIRYLLLAPLLMLAGILTAPIAASTCTSADGMTLCPMDDEDGNLQMPTLPAPTGNNWANNRQPGYSYGPGAGYNHYYDHGYRWFTP